MQNYELTIVLDGKATAAKKTAMTKLVEKVLSIGKGKMGKVEDWGERDLAYKIGKSIKGQYLFMPIEMPTSFVKQLDTKLKMEESVIRYLIVKA